MATVLGDRIRILRENAELTQIDFAKVIHVSNTALSQYEKGTRIPSDDVKIKIADYFGVSVDYLLGIKNKKIKTARGEQPISDDEERILNICGKLPPEEVKKVLDYVELLELRNKP